MCDLDAEHANGPADQPEVEFRRAFGSAPDCVLAENRPDRLAEDLVAPARVGGVAEQLRNDPDERDRRFRRVAERRLAAARVPAVDALRREAHSDDALRSAIEGDRRGRYLNDVRTAVGVEEIGATEVVTERLAVVAVADDAVDRAGRHATQAPLNLPTPTRESTSWFIPNPRRASSTIECAVGEGRGA